MFRNFDIIDFIEKFIWTAAKYIFIMLIAGSAILQVLAIFVEFKYIEPGETTYHLYEECKYISNEECLRRIKSKEIRENGYTVCDYCKNKRKSQRQAAQERREANERQYYPLR